MSQAPGDIPFKQAHLLGWVPTVVNQGPLFDPLTTSASDLVRLLESGKVTSQQILNDYYRQILKYNGYLHAVLQLAPGAIDRAKELDAQRARGETLGPLHGIPILLKDNIGTEVGMGMMNTGCNVGLAGSYTTKNSTVVDRLIEAGVIIMGKTTLSEMMWFKGANIRCGWSSLHGQAQNPYIKGGTDPDDGLGGHSSPDGSSTGSAIAVAAGMAPLALGTETAGSLVLPCIRQGLYTLKSSIGAVPNEGIMPVSFAYDVAGPLCKTTQDTVTLLSIIAGAENSLELSSAIKGKDGWKELRVGTLAPGSLPFDSDFMAPVDEATEQLKAATLDAYERIREQASAYRDGITLPPESAFNLGGSSAILDVWLADFQLDFDQYLTGTQGSKVRSAEDLAAWNRAHASLALPPEFPSQALIEASIAFDNKSDKRRQGAEHAAQLGKHVDAALDKHDLNVIIAPGDSRFCLYSAATGYPSCSLPLGSIEYLGRRVGLQAIARSEATLVTLMSAFEAISGPREPPSAFLDHEGET